MHRFHIMQIRLAVKFMDTAAHRFILNAIRRLFLKIKEIFQRGFICQRQKETVPGRIPAIIK